MRPGSCTLGHHGATSPGHHPEVVMERSLASLGPHVWQGWVLEGQGRPCVVRGDPPKSPTSCFSYKTAMVQPRHGDEGPRPPGAGLLSHAQGRGGSTHLLSGHVVGKGAGPVGLLARPPDKPVCSTAQGVERLEGRGKAYRFPPPGEARWHLVHTATFSGSWM